MSISVIVLAAGKGTRMKSELPKVLHHVLGKTLLSHVFDALSSIDNKFVVVGHESDLVINSIPSLIKNVIQKEQLGTGHAVSIAINSEVFNEIKSEFTLVVPGDVPAINEDDIDSLIDGVKKKASPVGFLTAFVDNPFGYGRVVKNNQEIKIVEEKDCSEEEKAINEINSGVYCFRTEFLVENIDNLNTENAQGEFYLTDFIGIENNQKQDIFIVQVDEN